jgi:hypothetical protein
MMETKQTGQLGFVSWPSGARQDHFGEDSVCDEVAE